MTHEDFIETLTDSAPPEGVGLPLQALWHERHGDWTRAHALAQAAEDADGSWVHAYLHRREGDDANARHWYARAHRSLPDLSLDDEWSEIVRALL